MENKLLLFDLDGVLVDACEWHYIALNRALKEICDLEISREDHETTYNGLPTSVKLEMLGIAPDVAESVWALKQKYTVDTIKKHAEIDDQKIEMHRFFKDKGYVVGCVTNSIRKTATLMLEKTGQICFMDLLVTNEDVTRSKPAPDCYLKAIEELGFEGMEDCVYIVEDSEKGAQSARQTKARLIRVKDPTEVTVERILSEVE